MKFIFLSCLIIINFTSFTFSLISKPHISIKELNFASKHKNHTIGDLINFEINPDGEISCKANQDIYEMKILFKISKDYLICSFDYFPYKIE